MTAHSKIVSTLSELCENYPDYDSSEIHRGKALPRDAQVPVGKSPLHLNYKPDLWVKRKPKDRPGARWDVYEVWDSESEAKAVYEILRVAYTPGVISYCIVCVKDSWTKKEAVRYIRAVLDNLKGPEITYDESVSVAEVDETDLSDQRRLRRTLARQLQF